MATKKCKNGRIYDDVIYGENCPFCPSPTGLSHENDFEYLGIIISKVNGEEYVGISYENDIGGGPCITYKLVRRKDFEQLK